MKKYTFVDLFAGCGGLSEGFMSSDKFDGLAHVEWELPMVNTLRTRLVEKWNHSEEEALARVIHFDIQKTDELFKGEWSEETEFQYRKTNSSDVVEKGMDSLVENKNVDLIIGGPPCQAYSIAGRAQDKNSMKDDYRNYLFESFVTAVDHYKPRIFLFENVPGILSAKPGNRLVTERIFEAFEQIGYEIREPQNLKKSLYFASDFGVPQKRNRVIIIGIRKNSGDDLEEIYKYIDMQKVSIQKTVEDAIADLPVFLPMDPRQSKGVSHYPEVESDFKISNIEPRFHNPRDISVFGDWLTNNMNGRKMHEKIEYYNIRMGKQSNHAKYRNLEWDKPSPTIVAHLYKDGLMFIHPDSRQARSITVREAARLQSFPDDYRFVSSMGTNYKMIGNAVPVLMAQKIAEGISNYLKKQ